MKKIITVFLPLLLIIIFVFTGCSSKMLKDSYPQDLNVSHDDNFQVFKLYPDWPKYNSIDEIVNASTNVYSGYVTDISFDIIDYSTGMSDNNPNSTSKSRTIFTVYTVSLKTNYKGKSPSEIKICKIGGILGYKENEQYDLLRSSMLIPEGSVGIYVSDDDCRLAIGNEYLFCISRLSGDFDHIINPYQFAYHIDSENAKSIIKFFK